MEGDIIIKVGKCVYEVRDDFLPEGQCKDCAAFEKEALCRKLPDCTGIYFRKLTSYEIRQLKKHELI
jgi:hypothetical protein